MSNLGLKDIPIEKMVDECLGLTDYADALSEFVIRCETPLTIALQGDWGSGKTSMMNLIKEKLGKDNPNIHAIWFNTWQYSQFGMTDDLALSLISHFVDKVGADDSTRKLIATMKLGLGKASKLFGSMTAMVAGESVAEVAEKVTEKLYDQLTKEESDQAKQIQKLKEDIEKSVTKLINEKGKDRVVVFIDDLDRLLPVKAVELLEVFKLFLDVPGCVYVLACDYQVVSQGLVQKFGVGAAELKGKSFFDKIIQLPFSMPLGQYNVQEYIKKLLERINVEFEEDDLVLYSDMINYSTGFNPRGLKRLFNSLLLLNIVAEKRGVFTDDSGNAIKSEKQKIMFGTLCLQTAYDGVYNLFQKRINMINNDFFLKVRDEDTLKTDDTLADIREALNDKDGSVTRQFSEFMDVFFQSIQLKSDTDKDNLSDIETKVLQGIMRFSSITSTESIVPTKEMDYDIRWANRELAKELLEIMNRKYKEHLAKIGSKLKIYQGRGQTNVDLYFDVKLGSYNIQIGFWFVNEYDDEVVDCIAIFTWAGVRSDIEYGIKWVNQYCKEKFPNMTIDPDDHEYAALYVKKYSPNTPFDVRKKDYEEMITSNIEFLLNTLYETKTSIE